jgi:two-component system cell cycle response regulator DivK
MACKTILIVEDNALNMKLFGDVLEAQGYTTLRVRDGEAAIDAARSGQPNLVLMDIHLPGRSGVDIAKEMKLDPTLRDIPVVAITAYALRGDRERILAVGCSDYVAKPVSIDRLIDVVAAYAA